MCVLDAVPEGGFLVCGTGLPRAHGTGKAAVLDVIGHTCFSQTPTALLALHSAFSQVPSLNQSNTPIHFEGFFNAQLLMGKIVTTCTRIWPASFLAFKKPFLGIAGAWSLSVSNRLELLDSWR